MSRRTRRIIEDYLFEAPWDTLPRGWTDDSLEKYWDTLVGDTEEKVQKCINKISSGEHSSEAIDDPETFCRTLAAKMGG